MGQALTSEESDSRGLHVLKVETSSPAAKAGFQPYFDYIVGVNGQDLVNHVLMMFQWSFSSGTHEPERHEPHSPAQQAGLHPETDYILAVREHVLPDKDSLLNLLEMNVGNPLLFLVYSSVLDTVREVKIIPLHGWGGPGCIGCDIGYGPLHALPQLIDHKQLQNTTPEVAKEEEERPLPPPPQSGFIPRKQLMQVVTKARSVLPNQSANEQDLFQKPDKGRPEEELAETDALLEASGHHEHSSINEHSH
ncbi:Golgi reassembly-stacking protein 1 [Phlyctochytrium bullatum]|nr:Golgi reassembly-stacking protein 1 [Phlyctochytrium bullatum]